jgi:hypothetical protein
MANSDKNILITPSTSSATGIYPSIKMTGSGNTPITLSVLDDNSLSFSGSAGQLFSISNSLTGSIFSVNDISGIPSIEVIDSGLIKLNQYSGQIVIGSSAAITVSSVPAMISAITRSATTPGLIIKGFTSQSADYFQIQNSGAAILAQLNASNQFNVNYGSIYASGGVRGGSNNQIGFAGVSAFATNAAYLALGIKGFGSQTANLTEWQNSAGTVLSAIDPAGNFTKGDGDQLLLAGQIF